MTDNYEHDNNLEYSFAMGVIVIVIAIVLYDYYTMFFTKAKTFFLDILFPPLCVHCHAHLQSAQELLCVPCATSITLHNSLFCGSCMRRLPEAKKTCHQDTPYILGAAGEYDNPAIASLIHALKYNKMERAAPFLGILLVHYAETAGLDTNNFCVVPVPLSKKRMRERGFNQAELIAAFFAAHFQIPLHAAALIKTTHTKPQMGLARVEREKNLIGCFEVLNDSEIKGKNIVLIDDVSTSGTTLAEASRALKRAGAKKIIGLVAAKA